MDTVRGYMSFQLQFLGGAGTVTGSKYLIQYKDKKVLIDCGLFQGLKKLRLKNWQDLPFPESEIDAVILTHAHIDHSGYIPRIVKNGFRGKIYSTQATKDLCRILLPDAGYLQEEEAEYLNKHKKTKHQPALPLFTLKDAEESLKSFVGVEVHEDVELFPGFNFHFRYAGHILGAASVILEIGDKKVAFSGDIGRMQDDILYPPEKLHPVDYLVTESTYGNRLHAPVDTESEILKVVLETYERQGVLIIPAFAVGRAQTMMYYLWKLQLQNKIPKIPMYLNSPMSISVNELLVKYKDLHKISEADCHLMCQAFRFVKTSEESKALNLKTGPMIIISASGMLSGGRVLHHLKAFGSDPRNTILLAGYQAAGTRGEALEKGSREIKVHGEYIDIRAQVVSLENISAHADYKEMIELYRSAQIFPTRVFITHGESSAADEFRRRLSESLDWNCEVPELGETVEL